MWQQKWIIGNWKMHGSRSFNQALLDSLLALPDSEQVLVGVTVPQVYLSQARTQLADAPVLLGAQDVSRFDADGAYTGEVSARMLADVGAGCVLIGHSERRQYFAEDETVLAAKLQHSVRVGLIPILCVGEDLAEREAQQHEVRVAQQLSILTQTEGLQQLVVAYEPVWAIGTGKVAEVEQIAAMHDFIQRKILSLLGKNVSIRVLYGGSVNASNAEAILATDKVDGALIGGASLKADDFARIVADAHKA